MKKLKFSKESIKKTKKSEDHTGMVLFILRDNPMTFEQIISEFEKMHLNFSYSYRDFFEPKRKRKIKKRKEMVERNLNFLEKSGHIEKIDIGNRYQITELGKKDLKTFDKRVNKFRKTINNVLNPRYSPIGSLVVHFIIGALKLSGFFLYW
jgi:DNA-binding PadR family transcriptional regulator